MTSAPPMTAPQIQLAYAEAIKHHAAGQSDHALELLGGIVEANPNIPEVHFQIARIFLAADRYDRAETHYQAAARLKPTEPVLWSGWAGAIALLGDSTAEKAFLAALKAAPIAADLRIALQNRFGAQRAASKPALGGASRAAIEPLLALMSTRRFAEAEARAIPLLRQHPGAAIIANILASAQAAQGKTAAAISAFQQTLKLDPFYAEAHANLGQLYLDTNQPDAAKVSFRDAVACAPALTNALTALAILHNKAGNPNRAVPLLERALKTKPDHVVALIALGNAQTRLHDFAAAEITLTRAKQVSGGKIPEALAILAQAQARLGKDVDALHHYQAALALAPDLPTAQGGIASLLQMLGRFDEAEVWFRRVFDTDPLNGENYRLFIASHKTKPDDPILAQMQARFDDPKIADADRMNLGFAIAKALDDIKDYGRVFGYLNTANALMRKLYPYDLSQRLHEVKTVQAAMSGIDWLGRKINGTTDYAPIFVTGMPRSGTTLVEQIIASHSLVEGAGEVGDGTRIVQRLMFENPGGPRNVASLSDEEIISVGRDYEAMMRARFGDAPHLTDKSIQTYQFLGLFKLAMPRAKIIVVRRDPRDTLLSIYKNKFPDGTHLYAYDLADLGHYYTTFTQMIDFWRNLVPDWFYEVQYEALVANPEVESRKLIAACGLEWEDNCLNFHQNTRKVETLSVFQVRQPMSQASVKSWARYGDAIAPLLDALKEDGHVVD
ncbi:MAG: sulfotransferase [Paracoccaceae bacterium]